MLQKAAQISALCTSVLLIAACAAAQTFDGLALKATITLPAVSGRIDHMAVDTKMQRAFVAALGNNTIEMVDLKEGRWLRSIKNFSEPQGVLFLSEANRLIVTNGGDGTCAMLDGTSLKVVKTIPSLDDADNVRYNAANGRVYVAYGEGALAEIDPRTLEITARLSLTAHPESFQIAPSAQRIFVNVPDEKKVVVFDAQKIKPIASWVLTKAERNYPMAIDEEHHRLFVGCREPARLLVYDWNKGALTASLAIGGDVDDIFFDAKRHRLYASCGEGKMDVFFQESPDRYRSLGAVATRKGARTSLLIPEMDLLLVAMPRMGNEEAQLRVYSIK